jgi:hypothetical protein
MKFGIRLVLLAAAAALALGQSLSLPAASSQHPGYEAMTAKDRARWVASSTVGPSSLISGVFTEALATRSNSPEEYGTHWDGFGKRYGLRLSGRATSSLMEAGLGSLWGEDPRYVRTSGQPLRTRINNVLRMTYTAHDRSGHEMPAYARSLAIPGSAFLSNVWRPDSQTQLRDAFGRISFSLVGRVLGNAFSEFGPDIRKRFSKKKDLSDDLN